MHKVIKFTEKFIPEDKRLVKGKRDVPLSTAYLSLKNAFIEAETITHKFSPRDRHNISITYGHYDKNEKRINAKTFLQQEYIPFDIDLADRHLKDLGLHERSTEKEIAKTFAPYVEVICAALRVSPDTCLTLFTGHGMAFLIKTTQVIKSIPDFRAVKGSYQRACTVLDYALKQAKLPFKEVDVNVFAVGRTVRVPTSLNLKMKLSEDKSSIVNDMVMPVVLLCGEEKAYNYDLNQLFPPPDNNDIEVLNKGIPTVSRITSLETLEDNCHFVRWCKDNPAAVTEPQWYTLIKLLIRTNTEDSTVHDYSNGHPNYSPTETDEKIKAAKDGLQNDSEFVSCNYVETNYKCQQCPNYKKIHTPLRQINTDGFRFLNKNGSPGGVDHDSLLLDFRDAHNLVSVRNSQLYVYTGTYWKHTESARNYLASYAYNKITPTVDTKHCVEFSNRALLHDWGYDEQINPDISGLLNFQNGTLVLHKNGTKVFRPHDPKDGLTYAFDFDYDDKANCPLFESCMDDWFISEDRDVFLEFFAYTAFHPNNDFERLVILFGTGANGKSTLLEIMQGVIGESNILHMVNVNDLCREYYRAKLYNKKFLLMEEAVHHLSNNHVTSYLKAIASGNILSGRHPADQPFNFRPFCKPLMTCNELPKFLDKSVGFRRKIVPIHMKSNFEHNGRKIIGLHRKIIESEASGIVNLLLRFYRKILHANNLTSKSQSSATLISQMASSPIHEFIRDHIEIAPDESSILTGKNMWESYQYYREYTLKQPILYTQRRFYIEVKDAMADMFPRHPLQRAKEHKIAFPGLRIFKDS